MGHSQTIINDQQEPSVTEIISLLNRPYLTRWYGKLGNVQADKVSKEAAFLGRNVHSLIESYIVNGSINGAIGVNGPTEQELKLFNSWLNWFNNNKVSVVMTEKKVISNKYLYGGTFDAIIVLNC